MSEITKNMDSEGAQRGVEMDDARLTEGTRWLQRICCAS